MFEIYMVQICERKRTTANIYVKAHDSLIHSFIAKDRQVTTQSVNFPNCILNFFGEVTSLMSYQELRKKVEGDWDILCRNI